jgi:hypothetical protein
MYFEQFVTLECWPKFPVGYCIDLKVADLYGDFWGERVGPGTEFF